MEAVIQETLLSYLLRGKLPSNVRNAITATFFATQEDILIWRVCNGYIDNYLEHPERAVLESDLAKEFKRLSRTEMQNFRLESVSSRLSSIYEFSLDVPMEKVVREVEDEVMRAKSYVLMAKLSEKMASLEGEELRLALIEIGEVGAINLVPVEDVSEPVSVIHENYTPQEDNRQSWETPFVALNNTMAKGGFSQEELIVFVAHEKAFKTGLLLMMACYYSRQGLKVYYADLENGISNIRRRTYQTLLNCNVQELESLCENGMLDEEKERIKEAGGDVVIKKYATSASMKDLEKDLVQKEKEEKWSPDILIIDYIDIFLGGGKQIQTIRERIQDNYMMAKSIIHRFQCLCITISHTNRQTRQDKGISTSSLAEDFAKARHASAIIAIERDGLDMMAQTGRLRPIVQRDGIAGEASLPCYIKIEPERALVQEIDKSSYYEAREQAKVNHKKEEVEAKVPEEEVPF